MNFLYQAMYSKQIIESSWPRGPPSLDTFSGESLETLSDKMIFRCPDFKYFVVLTNVRPLYPGNVGNDKYR